MLLRLRIPILPAEATKALFRLPLFLVLCVSPALSQKAQADDGTLPKYDLHTETKTKGVVDEVKLLPLGTRKDFTELIIKSGDDKVHIYVCPKPFQEEIASVSPKEARSLLWVQRSSRKRWTSSLLESW